MKLLVVCLDGATFRLIRPWAQAGHLPTLTSLLHNGACGELRSTLPPISSPAWPSFMTGMNPGRHGVFDFVQLRQGALGVVSSAHIGAQTLWQHLSDAGLRVGVFSVPVTYPPSPVHGFMVTGMLSPRSTEITYPRGLLEDLEPELGPYRIGVQTSYAEGHEAEYAADLSGMMAQRARYALRLLHDQPWDFAIVHFGALDLAQHALWRFVDPSHPRYNSAAAQQHGHLLLDHYRQADSILAQLWELLGPEDSLIVMSDHGFGPLHGTVNLNNILRKHGFLRLKRDPINRLRHALFRMGLTPKHIYRLLTQLHVQNVVTRFSRQAQSAIMGQLLPFSAVDWTRTTAYSIGHIGQIFINLQGRDPHGIVPPQQYHAERQRVADLLRQLRHPTTGAPLVTQILFNEDVYTGPHAHRGADILLTMDDGRYIAFPLFASSHHLVTPKSWGDSGCHRLQGILMACGPHIRRGAKLEGAQIIDLAPTILHQLGVPVPKDMDGRVLTEMFDQSFLTSRPVRRAGTAKWPVDESPERTPQEDAEVRARLQGRGYLS